jgi:hypothetical protein
MACLQGVSEILKVQHEGQQKFNVQRDLPASNFRRR